MTRREHETLECILRSVATYNGREVKGVKFDHLVISRNGQPQMGDLVIERVEFQPTGAKCA